MITVERTNLYSAVYTNIKEVLVTNTSGVPVKSSFSKSTIFPVIVFDFSKEPQSKTIEGVSSYIVTIEIRLVGKTVTALETLTQEIENLMYTNNSNFLNYNMPIYNGGTSKPEQIERNGERAHTRLLVFEMGVAI